MDLDFGANFMSTSKETRKKKNASPPSLRLDMAVRVWLLLQT